MSNQNTTGGYGIDRDGPPKYDPAEVPQMAAATEADADPLEVVIVEGGPGVRLLNSFGYFKPTEAGVRYYAGPLEESSCGGYGRTCYGIVTDTPTEKGQ